MATVEDILLARAMQDQANKPSYGDAAIVGSALGALGGVAAGQPVHALGSALNKVSGRQGRLLKPGFRLAGGLTGLVLGGGLGLGTRALMTETSDAGRLLGKLQAGTFTEMDKYQLEQLLAASYGKLGAA